MTTRTKINEFITLEVNFPEHMSMQQLREITHYIDTMIKNVSKYDVFSTIKKSSKKESEVTEVKVKTKKPDKYYINGIPEWANSREKSISLLKLHYFGTKEQKSEFLKKNKIPSCSAFGTMMHRLIARHNINPKEIDLKRFPTQQDRNNHTDINKLKLK